MLCIKQSVLLQDVHMSVCLPGSGIVSKWLN